MIFHEKRLLAEISYLILFGKLEDMSQYLSSAAVVIGALRVKKLYPCLKTQCLIIEVHTEI